MRILKDVELVEALGFGIRGITKIYDRDIFEFTDGTLYVQLFFDTEVTGKSRVEGRVESRVEGRVESRVEIIKILQEAPTITAKGLADKLDLSLKTIEKHLKILRDENKIQHTGAKKSGKWVVNNDGA
jgi:predicted HTH transcriptional regulator